MESCIYFFETFLLLSRNKADCLLSCRLNIISPKAELVTRAVEKCVCASPRRKEPSVEWVRVRA